jgi:RNA polymerase sigma-70 factor (ECF subfamily)
MISPTLASNGHAGLEPGVTTSVDDKALTRRLLAGDEPAFEEFFAAYFPRLFRFALPRVGGDEDAAEEATQAALVKGIEKLHTYRGEAALFTWLCAICRNEIVAVQRRTHREPALTLVEDAPEIRAALEALASDAPGPDAALRHAELARLVRATLDCLPRHYAAALEWKYVHDLAVREIAARLGVAPKAAESLLARAREAFREGFAASTGGWPPLAADPDPNIRS